MCSVVSVKACDAVEHEAPRQSVATPQGSHKTPALAAPGTCRQPARRVGLWTTRLRGRTLEKLTREPASVDPLAGAAEAKTLPASPVQQLR